LFLDVLRAALVDVGITRRVREHLLHPLAQLEPEELRNESTPTGLQAGWSIANDDNAVIVAHSLDGPGSSSKKERAHLLHEPIDEVLLEGPEVAAGRRDDAVEDRRREDGVELQEVLL